MVRKAEFDHVDKNGAVILKIGDEHVELDDSDAFEQGLLASKQVKAEERTDSLPPESESLPISQIQNLVRAGISTDKIAAKYSMEPALIRRFAQPIEQEKKSAIAQFLTVNIRQNDEVHRLGQLINSILSQAGVDTSTVEWSASRRKREPWRINASFAHQDHAYKATWSWNMRDNAVVAINPTAKKLLGESDAAARDLLFGDKSDVSISTDVPQSGPTPPSWMIEGGQHHAESPAEQKHSPAVSAPASKTEEDSASSSLDAADRTTTLNPLINRGNAHVSALGQKSAQASDEIDHAQAHSQEDSTKSASAGTSDTSKDSLQGISAEHHANKMTHRPAQSAPSSSDAEKQNEKRRPRRNAIPSWDDIIFGK